MGTVVSYSLSEASTTTEHGAETAPGPAPAASRRRARTALARAEAKLVWVDEVFSTWRPDSPVSRLRRGEIELEQAPPEVAEVLELCRRARDASDGWFDPWGMPGGVDPTGLVKGWGAERALDELKAAGVPGAMVNAGGDIAVYGRPAPGLPWSIAVRDPREDNGLLLVVEFDGAGAVATSGRYERGDHMFVPDVTDPERAEPARGLLQATVIGLDLTFADALATALFVSDGKLLERLGRLRGYHGIVMGLDGTLRASPGFPFHLAFPPERRAPARPRPIRSRPSPRTVRRAHGEAGSRPAA
jgi:FAD:protein FMN transferase